MIVSFRVGMVLMLLCSLGCSGSVGRPGEPGDPKVRDVLLAHWEAMHSGDWRGPTRLIHPDLKAAGLTLKRFTALHAERLKMKGVPPEHRNRRIRANWRRRCCLLRPVRHASGRRRASRRYRRVAKRRCANRATRGH